MSRTRLIASLTAISCCLALVLALAARTFPLKAAPRLAQSALEDGAAPLLQRIEVKHHDFDSATLNDAIVNEEGSRMSQLPGRLTVETAYDQARSENMKKFLEGFWNGRRIVVEVRSSLMPSRVSRRHAILEFDVYKQTLLPGRLEGGLTGGVAAGVAGGLNGGPFGSPSGGMTGGISGARAIRSAASQKIPDVDYSTVWIDTVKRGTFYRVVSGLGSLVRAENSTNLIARVILPASMVSEVRPNQTVTFNTRKDLMKGHVIGLNAPSSDETRTVYIGLDGPLPEWAVADLPVEARIDIEKIENTLYVGRPSNVPENSAAASVSASLFKIAPDGKGADRVIVKFGRPSVNTVEVLDGLQAGDRVILSDMSAFGNHIHFIKQMHLEKH